MHAFSILKPTRHRWLSALLACVVLLHPAARSQSSMAVQHAEGLVHGFLVLRAQDGTALADGDLTQVAHGDKVTGQLAFHFKDGSLQEETSPSAAPFGS